MVIVVLASSNTFERLAVLANVALLLLYSLCCIATVELLRKDVRTGGTPFSVPGARVIPVAALAVIVGFCRTRPRTSGRWLAPSSPSRALYVLRRMLRSRGTPAVESVD